METARRTLVKAVLWNALGLVVMGVVGLVMTGSVALGWAMAVLNTAIGLACNIVYERIWSRIRWGRLHG